MQMMKERMDFMMNALRRQVSSDLNDLVHRTDSPFKAFVTPFPLPLKFRMPQVENYDGSKDPLDHLKSFKTLMHLQGVPDEIMCKAFPTTLKRSEDLAQQADAQLHWNLQGVKRPVHLTLHRKAQVQ